VSTPLSLDEVAREPARLTSRLCADIDYRRLLPFLALVDSDPQDTPPQDAAPAESPKEEFPTQDTLSQDAAPAGKPKGEFRGAFCRETHKRQEVVGYFLIQPGLRDDDRERYVGHGHPLVEDECCTFAPCVTDAWQQRGLGSALFPHVAACVRRLGRRHLVLWGGVRGDNPRAVHFYRKFGFRPVGDFAAGGVTNLDMVLDL
jgi:GNAT superfamily N-acetyltransferase